MSRATTLALLAVIAVAAVGCGPPSPPAAPTQIDGLDADGLLKRARDAAAALDLDRADRAYRDAYRVRGDVAIVAEHVRFLLRVGRVPAGLAVADELHRARAADGSADDVYAEALLAAGRGSDANAVADAMLVLDPKGAAGHEKKGRAELLLDQTEAGLLELRAARDFAPDVVTYHLALGVALDKLAKVDEAQIEFRQAVKLAPDDVEANVDLAMALREQQVFEEARTYVSHALAVAPRSGHAYFELGRLDNAQQLDADAEAALAKAVEYAPYESLYWYAYGEVFRLHDRDDEAIKAYTQALALVPPAPKARAKLGVVLAREQRWDEAERALTAAVKEWPQDAAVHMSLGDVYAGTGRGKLAVESYRKYLELAGKEDGERGRVSAALAKLRGR